MPSLTLLLLDLDDTLLDTSGVLAPAAHREAVRAMMDAGLPGELDALLAERRRLSRLVPPHSLSLAQVGARGLDAPEIAAAGDAAYFDRDVPPIQLEEGVEAMLRRLHVGRRLVLVTSGVERTQRAKVDRLGLHWLDEIVYAPVGGAEVKEAAFKGALRALPTPVSAAVAVGDRLDSEIVAANRLGLWAVHVDRGEGARRLSDTPDGIPDLTVGGPLGIEAAVEALEARAAQGKRPLGSRR